MYDDVVLSDRAAENSNEIVPDEIVQRVLHRLQNRALTGI